MWKRAWIGVVVALAAIAGLVVWLKRPKPVQYLTAPAKIGNVQRTVTTTGSLNPVITVQVGSYVSGPIQAIYCDYNTRVKMGQLCAKIDPKPFQVAVDEAQANLASAQAQVTKDQASLAYAKINYQRDAGLLGRGIVSQDTVDNDRSVYRQDLAQIGVDQAAVQQRAAALEAAKVNLGYTNIVSPVNGTVVSRNVNVGQTVAASFQTPTLFLIAKDLTKMEVDTNVSESDIGALRVGQQAIFTVDAYPEEAFHGVVWQIRKAPITVQNVVTYDAVIEVANPKLLLFPGMTANARIITEQRDAVLTVPVAALRFTPAGPAGAGMAVPANDRVYVLRNGKPATVPVKAGLSDGVSVEIKSGDLHPGEQVIVGERTGAQPARAMRPRFF